MTVTMNYKVFQSSELTCTFTSLLNVILIWKNTLLWTYPNLTDLHTWSTLAQFRCGVLIKYQDWNGTIYVSGGWNERLCVICSTKAKEDIFHFLYHCTSYSNLKIDFFTSNSYDSRLHDMSDSDCTSFLLSNFPRQIARF